MENIVLFDKPIKGTDYKAIGSNDDGKSLTLVLVPIDEDETEQVNWIEVDVTEEMETVDEYELTRLEITMIEYLVEE